MHERCESGNVFMFFAKINQRTLNSGSLIERVGKQLQNKLINENEVDALNQGHLRHPIKNQTKKDCSYQHGKTS